jgi:hypothetical protein
MSGANTGFNKINHSMKWLSQSVTLVCVYLRASTVNDTMKSIFLVISRPYQLLVVQTSNKDDNIGRIVSSEYI